MNAGAWLLVAFIAGHVLAWKWFVRAVRSCWEPVRPTLTPNMEGVDPP